jgi:hypothetical protein
MGWAELRLRKQLFGASNVQDRRTGIVKLRLTSESGRAKLPMSDKEFNAHGTTDRPQVG